MGTYVSDWLNISWKYTAKEVTKCTPQPLPPATLPLPPSAASTPKPMVWIQDPDMPMALPTESPAALQGASFQSNIVQTGRLVPPDAVTSALQTCRSRRNLVMRLATKIFTVPERSRSNCRGVLGKKALDVYKVKAIKLHPCSISPCYVWRHS